MIFYIPLSVVHSVNSGDITDTIVVDGSISGDMVDTIAVDGSMINSH